MSLIEMMVVATTIVVLSTFAVVNINTIKANARVETAFQIVVRQLNLSRQCAIDRRVQCVVSFSAPGTIKTQYIKQGTTFDLEQVSLPTDISFTLENGMPKGNNLLTPDNFGTGTRAIDFSVDYGGGGTAVYFQPDGSARDAQGRINNGVVYMVRPGSLQTGRAVTVFGGTGRIKGWTIQVASNGTAKWR